MADPVDREAAVAATDERCPRCSAPREPGQEYCLECGLHLPPVTGTVPSLRRGWIGRIGWYPGDWIWIAAVTLVVAIAGAAVSIVVTTHRGGSGGTTLVGTTSPPVTTTTPPPQTTTTTPAVTHPRTTTKTKTKTAAAPPEQTTGRTLWPAGFDGWTIVLGSYPVTAGKTAPLASADRAARNGLPDVGVLDSANYASLHPGYYVVFTGMYHSEAQAHAALRVAAASGFPGAYPRQVSR
ncbi:MAG TPA: zinc ribbon domain-containing protein [Gaiellaceae bacterium]|nr:zinc ribbon domain-containing protein [Gaiellaceae bacterium]